MEQSLTKKKQQDNRQQEEAKPTNIFINHHLLSQASPIVITDISHELALKVTLKLGHGVGGPLISLLLFKIQHVNLSWLYIYISSALNHNLEIKVWSKPSGGVSMWYIGHYCIQTWSIQVSNVAGLRLYSIIVQWSWASECSTATYICSNPHGECRLDHKFDRNASQYLKFSFFSDGLSSNFCALCRTKVQEQICLFHKHRVPRNVGSKRPKWPNVMKWREK